MTARRHLGALTACLTATVLLTGCATSTTSSVTPTRPAAPMAGQDTAPTDTTPLPDPADDGTFDDGSGEITGEQALGFIRQGLDDEWAATSPSEREDLCTAWNNSPDMLVDAFMDGFKGDGSVTQSDLASAGLTYTDIENTVAEWMTATCSGTSPDSTF